MTLDQIKEALGDIDLANCNTRLSPCEVIEDVQLFLSSHINYLESNSGNKAYLPYYNRLLNFIQQNT